MPWTAAGAREATTVAEGLAGAGGGGSRGGCGRRVGAGDDDGSWSGGVDRGSGAPAYPQLVGMSPTSLRHCQA